MGLAAMINAPVRWVRSWFTPDVVFQFSHEFATLPARGSGESAGLDLYAVEEKTIDPGATAIIKTGLRCTFNPGWVALIWDRSGMGAKGYHRYAGCIDSDYRGDWGVVLHNSTGQPVTIKPYDRVAQVVFQRCWIGQPKLGVVINDTERGEGGFGSTGK
jgi:deoxyuridine 5'-triphosphate nucleotidohydrolase